MIFSSALAFDNNNSGIGAAGSTLHYTAYGPRPQPDDFKLHTDFSIGADWSIGYKDLENYFDEIEQNGRVARYADCWGCQLSEKADWYIYVRVSSNWFSGF